MNPKRHAGIVVVRLIFVGINAIQFVFNIFNPKINPLFKVSMASRKEIINCIVQIKNKFFPLRGTWISNQEIKSMTLIFVKIIRPINGIRTFRTFKKANKKQFLIKNKSSDIK
jgi:hypothetical protein